jgi:hypothetical protein
MAIVRILEAHIQDMKRHHCERWVRGRRLRLPCGELTRTMATVEHDDGTVEDLWLCPGCESEIRELSGEPETARPSALEKVAAIVAAGRIEKGDS